jgi:hypothetical protein
MFSQAFFPIHKSLGYDIRREEFVALSELLERNPVGETLSANSDSLQDTVATELVQDKSGVDLTGLLLVIGNDASDKVGVGVSQSDHELSQLFLVEL